VPVAVVFVSDLFIVPSILPSFSVNDLSGLPRVEQDVEELRPRAVFTVDREVLRLAALAERLGEHEADDLRDVWRDDDEVFLPLLLDTDLLRRSSISESLSSLPNPAFR